MKRPKPVPGVVELLSDVLDSARAAEIVDVFVLYRYPEGAWESEHYTTDVDDMTLQLGSECMRIRARR